MTGAEMIAAERERQINQEGWTPGHDDEHGPCALAVAGASYVLDVAALHSEEHDSWLLLFRKVADDIFPFDAEWQKRTPSDPVRQLVKAGALIAAEIDRFGRKA